MIADNNIKMYSYNSFSALDSFAREGQVRKVIDVVNAVKDRG